MENEKLKLIHKNILKDDFAYAKQYEKAFELLIHSEENNMELPILFLLRHNIELLLKVNIKYFLKSDENNSVLKQLEQTHNLTKLYEIFKKQRVNFENVFPLHNDESELINNLQELIQLIDNIDNKQSIGLRYSHTKNGKHSFEEQGKIIHIKKIQKLAKKANIYLKNLKDFIEKKKDTN